MAVDLSPCYSPATTLSLQLYLLLHANEVAPLIWGDLTGTFHRPIRSVPCSLVHMVTGDEGKLEPTSEVNPAVNIIR